MICQETQTSKSALQNEEQNNCTGVHNSDMIADTDDNCLMKISNMEDFIRLSTAHAAKCGRALVLIERDRSQGAYVVETWQCPCCNGELKLTNCNKIKSKEVARGAAYSRKQPDFNLRILEGAELSGVNVLKLQEFLSGQLGIKIAADNNLRKQQTKVHEAVDNAYETFKTENREKAVADARASPDYVGDLKWTDDNGVEHSTCQAELSGDGSGATRIYEHKHRGHSSAYVVNDRRTGLPLDLIVSRVSHYVSR